MSFIPTIGAVRTDLQFSTAGGQAHNILWFSREANWTQSEREALNTALATWFTSTGRDMISSANALTQITTVNQEAANAPSSVLVVSPAIGGNNASTSFVPTSATCCATLRTALRGRSYRGRMYLAGPGSSGLLDNIHLTSTYIATVIAALGSLKTAIDALGAVWVIVSHFASNAARANGLKTPVSAIAVDNLIDNQRRRLGGRGV